MIVSDERCRQITMCEVFLAMLCLNANVMSERQCSMILHNLKDDSYIIVYNCNRVSAAIEK